MVSKKSIFGVLTALALIGCTTSNPVPISGATPVVNKKEVKTSIDTIEKTIEGANIVLIRRYAQPTAYPISIKIDGQKVASLGQRRYTAISLPEGEYDVVAKWPFIATQLPIEFKMTVDGNRKQYFEFLGEALVEPSGFQSVFKSYVGAREIESDKGSEYLSQCCKYVKPKKKK